jgi:hypothetical protein
MTEYWRSGKQSVMAYLTCGVHLAGTTGRAGGGKPYRNKAAIPPFNVG